MVSVGRRGLGCFALFLSNSYCAPARGYFPQAAPRFWRNGRAKTIFIWRYYNGESPRHCRSDSQCLTITRVASGL